MLIASFSVCVWAVWTVQPACGFTDLCGLDGRCTGSISTATETDIAGLWCVGVKMR